MAQVKLREKDFDDEIAILKAKGERQQQNAFDAFARDEIIRANALNSVLEDFRSKLAEKFPAEHTKPSPKPLQDFSAALEQEQTIQDMLEKFQYDPSLSAKDRHSLLRTSASLSKKDESRALWLTQNVRLRAWLTVDETSLLLVAGNAQHRPASPTSLVSAKLAAAAAGNVNMVVSSFFCGRHTDASVDADARPSELAMSLLLQLVGQYRGFGTGVVRECVDALEPECGGYAARAEVPG
ncbi:hypothetical protein UCRNP2_7930 [Neofusicoccum parvum UCRNP2]|uniref:Uncharacterized protein n=1 Tax=Botryosphaeria parva (strain UCR-NP2) TaxID=1287680 RepID=R1GAW0_BOTPV|nr:hypothetical protein UCRNP2_7930 [Neofusicoccum parvum UCRNP2]